MCFVSGKGRLYPAYSLSGSEGEADSPTHHYRSLRRQHPQQQQHPLVAANNPYQQHTYQQPYQHQYQQAPQQQLQQQHPAGLSDTPTSENASDATLTDSELALARDSTLLVHNGKDFCLFFFFPSPRVTVTMEIVLGLIKLIKQAPGGMYSAF